jgi:hypothetical protein
MVPTRRFRFRQLRSVLIPLLLVFAGCGSNGSPQGGPTIDCGTGGPRPLTLEHGQGIPLPTSYGGSTSSDALVTGTVLASNLLGPTHVVFVREMPKGTGLHLSAAPVMPTDNSPLGRANIEVDFTSNVTDTRVLARCLYDVTLIAPAGMPDLVLLPIRMCVIAGAPQAEERSDGQVTEGRRLLDMVARANDDTWAPYAHIRFRLASAPEGLPVIAGLRPPSADVDGSDLGGSAERKTIVDRCDVTWNKRHSGEPGTVVVVAGRFINAPGTNGETPKPAEALWVRQGINPLTGLRNDDLCGEPRRLTSDDVGSVQWTIVADPANYDTGALHGDAGQTLAHELGHTLLLGHGNGLDDNHDGLQPPTPGPRRYDEYCDPLALNPSTLDPREDDATPFVSCAMSSSVMVATAGKCTNLQPLQVEQARFIAIRLPGASFNP